MSKLCPKCLTIKEDSFFYRRSNKPHLLMSYCIDCVVKDAKLYRKKNIEKVRLKDALYHKNNREKRLSNLKKWQSSHKEYRLIKDAKRRKSDVCFVLRHRISNRIRMALKRVSKKSSSERLLGCSIDNLKLYIESKFVHGMTWESFFRGEIHIDHIYPCSMFDLSKEDQQMQCFHFSNLQPLFAKDNLKKRDRIEVCHF